MNTRESRNKQGSSFLKIIGIIFIILLIIMAITNPGKQKINEYMHKTYAIAFGGISLVASDKIDEQKAVLAHLMSTDLLGNHYKIKNHIFFSLVKFDGSKSDYNIGYGLFRSIYTPPFDWDKYFLFIFNNPEFHERYESYYRLIELNRALGR